MASKRLLKASVIALVIIILFVALPIIIALLSPSAHAAEANQWKEWGISPYASSQEDACKKAPQAIDGFGMPETVREYFKFVLNTTCEGGIKAWIPPDLKIEQMYSGPDVRHKVAYILNQESVAVLPVLKSPDGRAYRKGAVAETAKTLSWTFVHEGKTYVLYLPFVCFNWSWTFGPPVAPTLTPVPLKPIAGGCPNVYHLKVYVWEHKAITLPGVAQTAAKEELEEHFVYGRHDPQHVSRTHYTQFQKALAAGELRQSANAHVFQVSLIMTPEAAGGEPLISKEYALGDITVKDSFYEISFTLEQLQRWDAIRLVPVEDGEILSPPRYHKTGFHEMRFFNHLPNTKLGEWDSNPDPDCVMGEAWIEK